MTTLPFSNNTTSLAAARDPAVVANAQTQRGRVLEHLELTGGSTNDEMQVALNLQHNSLSPRLWQLVKDGLIEISDEQRPTRTGHMAHVYKLRIP